MDAVEIARQIAAELHARAVERGNDPWNSYTFAVAEARRRDLDVETTSPGAAILNGGRASFLPQDHLILHENAGSVFEQAFLVAHEIGHAELGDGTCDEPVKEIDFARSAEPSPTGLDRVVDYGRRQRREIQMDLFAREFLLPRSIVRALHLEEGLTATQIAAKLGAPFSFVAQQLFDALLLPAVSLSSNEKRQDQPLNDLQAAAAKHRGEAYLLEAGPGTGKTQTLIARVEGLLAEGVDPRRILLLTFSNKAAEEMAERIARKHRDAAAAMWVGTFHAFGLDIIRRFHAELGFPHDPQMMDRTEAVELLEYEFPRFAFRHYRDIYDPTRIIVEMLSAVSRAKDEVVDAREYARLAELMGPDEAGERAREVALFYAAYEKLKLDANKVDFGDLVLLPVLFLEKNNEIRRYFQGLYDHVIVDEYQDVNRSSVRLLTALKPDGCNLWAVGDARQSIYRFRGASSFNIARFGEEDFSGGKRGYLKHNYRSAEEITMTFSTFAQQMRLGCAEINFESKRGASGRHPELRTVRQAEQQTVALADAIEEMCREGFTFRDQAVLCTGNEKLSLLGRNLESLGIPILYLGSLFERPEVKDLISLLSLLTDRRARGLIRIGCLPDFAMSLADVAESIEHLRTMELNSANWRVQLEALSSLSEAGRAALRRLRIALDGFDQASSPWTVLATILLDRTRMAAHLAASNNPTNCARGIAIWQFLNFIRAQTLGQGLPITRLLDRIRRLVRLGDDRELRQLPAAAQCLDAVRLMTIHSAKGLEFPIVHIPGLNADTIPRSPVKSTCPAPEGMIEGAVNTSAEAYSTGQEEEQECLFYVALSRARDRLFLYAPTQKNNGYNRGLSPFLDMLGGGIIRNTFTPSRTLSTIPCDRLVNFEIEGPLRFEASQLALYESCPRRFFYSHVLHAGGRRIMTAFMQMHEAVRSVLESQIAHMGSISDEDLRGRVRAAFIQNGLADNGYSEELSNLAFEMLKYYNILKTGCASEESPAVSITLGNEAIVVRPDDIVVHPNGARTVRRIRTGHHRSRDGEDVGAAAFLLGVRQNFPEAEAELVYLSDREPHPISFSARKLQARQDKLTQFLQDIRDGRFPANAGQYSCPNCPAFFVCGPLPEGSLKKKFI